jgi:DNA-binding winged helix-turn-helix (wHTH) protein/TolB-like protein
MVGRVSERLSFGLFEFDPESGVLTRQGTPVRLQPQPARVLAMLASHAGEVVSREALRQEIWADGTFVDFERGLNFCIAQIRSALGDSADTPRFIETLPRRGYRFIAPVRPFEPDSHAGIGARTDARGLAQPGPGISLRSWVPLIALIGLVTVTALLVAGSWRAGAVDRRLRVAVVPFDNETGLDDFDQIARGVADATVARLATPERIRWVSVIGNAAALHQPRAFRDLKRIGTQLDADYIVLAQMKRDAAQVRLIAHLIRVPDEVHVWANTYDRPDFTLDVQAEIAESIASAVVKRLAEASSPHTGNS